VKLFVPCIPRGKGIARVVRLPNGMSHSYTPARTRTLESEIAWAFREQVAGPYPVFAAGVALCSEDGCEGTVSDVCAKWRDCRRRGK
jgi:hypothetical protein